jgi:hypothetical protein
MNFGWPNRGVAIRAAMRSKSKSKTAKRSKKAAVPARSKMRKLKTRKVAKKTTARRIRKGYDLQSGRPQYASHGYDDPSTTGSISKRLKRALGFSSDD